MDVPSGKYFIYARNVTDDTSRGGLGLYIDGVYDGLGVPVNADKTFILDVNNQIEMIRSAGNTDGITWKAGTQITAVKIE